MFSLDEKVVYPGHGVARICRIIEKNIAGSSARFFELEFFNKKMTILVPVDSVICAGIRKLSSIEHINDTFAILSEPFVKPVHETCVTNWNKRNKEYQCKIRTGNIREICKIYRDLRHISASKELSFGEKNLLDQTEFLLIEEISMVTHADEAKVIERLRSIFKNTDTTKVVPSAKGKMTQTSSMSM
jgi:CarD family transcriptional regulator